MAKPLKPDSPDKPTLDWLRDPFAEPAHERKPAGPARALGFSDQTYIVWERKHDGSFCFAIVDPDPPEGS
jgi:hypothetical protein